MRKIEIELPEPVANYIEIRAAIDDLRLKEGIEKLLINIVLIKKGADNGKI